MLNTADEIGKFVEAKIRDAEQRASASDQRAKDATEREQKTRDENIALTAMLQQKNARVEELERDLIAARLEAKQSHEEAGRIRGLHEAATESSAKIVGRMTPKAAQKVRGALVEEMAPELSRAQDDASASPSTPTPTTQQAEAA